MRTKDEEHCSRENDSNSASGPDAASATELVTAANVANASTASVGKFQEKLTNEKQARGIGVKRKRAQSRCRARRNAT
ncbi:hypothetical protein pipiens_004290 [Culex pipiens pipiens]|uniref:Uncharacterized protein n=1 Tax=Culex pipiens pipiens TaxID=38569 RepID=A0ABD1CK89_CULPP